MLRPAWAAVPTCFWLQQQHCSSLGLCCSWQTFIILFYRSWWFVNPQSHSYDLSYDLRQLPIKLQSGSTQNVLENTAPCSLVFCTEVIIKTPGLLDYRLVNYSPTMLIISSLLYDSKLDIFGWDIWGRLLGLWETLRDIFHHLLTF